MVLASRPGAREAPAVPPPAGVPHAIAMTGDDEPVHAPEAWTSAARRELAVTAQPATPRLGDGFTVVGGVAVLAGDGETVSFKGTGFGIERANLAAVTRRFVAAFGDDYDQIAVFLGFDDRASPAALAYQQPIKNDTQGIGLDAFDSTEEFGSRGRLHTALNMKRITLYGRDAANDPDNDLYSVWAQEAAHRWITYFRYRLAGDADDRKDLLGRQSAHWGAWVQADGSFVDGWAWQDNGDGTFTPLERDRRYGAMDQYGMGLRTAEEVPPFYLLSDLVDAQGRPVDRRGPFQRGSRYGATKTTVTVADVVRSLGPRVPAHDPSAEDLRMGVVLLTPPDTTTAAMIGEAFRIEGARRLWDEFYNTAGDGRGKVCSELLRPCRGGVLAFGAPVLAEAASVAAPNGIVEPGEAFVITVPVSNLGTDATATEVTVVAGRALGVTTSSASTPPLVAGATASIALQGRVPAGSACGHPLTVDVAASTERGPSRARLPLVFGLGAPAAAFDFESPASTAGWRADPDGTDTLVAPFVAATPERTSRFDFVFQPGDAHSGTQAFVTGPTAGEFPEQNAVRAGTHATLESPVITIAGLRDVRVAYAAYVTTAGFDLKQSVLNTGVEDALVVSASLDDGPFVEIDRVSGLGLAWQTHHVRLADHLPGVATAARLKLRFVADNEDVTSGNIVEAAIDDVAVADVAPGCTPGALAVDAERPSDPVAPPPAAHGGCSFAARGSGGFGAMLAAFALLVRRRRARPRRDG